MATEEVPVLVVGGSLVGLSAAVFLASHDVPVTVVEKHVTSSAHPRAIGYTTRTLEIFRATGIELPSAAQGHGPPRRARVESLAGTWLAEYPWTANDSEPRYDYSPERATAIAQDRLEPILRARAVELGADLRLGTALTEFIPDDDGVSVALQPRDGADYRLRARYVVAADGAGSPIRDALGIGRSGRGLLSTQRSILFRAPIDHYLDNGVVQFEIEQPTLTAFLTTYSDGRWVLMLGDDDRDPDQQLAVIRQAIGLPDLPVELLTTGRWELAALIADHFGAGRVFLAGDAAHQLPPNRGGYGANTGIEDAHNLAWKLAAVLRGEAPPRLLDSYDDERRPIAWLRHDQIFARADYTAHRDTSTVDDADVIDDIAMELGQLYRSAAVLDPSDQLPPARRPDQWAGQPGTRAPHLALRGSTSTLDLFGRGWVLLSQDDRWADAAALNLTYVQICPSEVLKPMTFQDAYGISSNGASLVRPDGYIAARWITMPADPSAELADAFSRIASARIPQMPDTRPADADSGLLDGPVWHALTGPHRRFAVTPDRGSGAARAYRYRVDVAPFATLSDVADPGAWRDLAELSGPGDRAALVAPSAQPAGTVSAGWSVADVLPCTQMIAPVDGVAKVTTRSSETLVPLGPQDAAEMVALAELTRPGPFANSTVELGGYLGVRREGRLVAMAGRRLHLPGWIEISAVCTHPDHRGQGLARLLIAAVDAAIRQQGHRAFLHAIHQNITAIELYRQLGFTTRADMTFTVVRFTAA